MASGDSMSSLLIVDDDPDLCSLLEEICRDLTDDITTASNGHEALDLIRKKIFHTILSDISMPEMNGLQLLSEVRFMGLDTPFVVLSGFGDKKNTVEALRLGASDFLEKPFDDKKLIQTLDLSLKIGVAVDEFKHEVSQLVEDPHLSSEKRLKLQEARKTIGLLKKEFEIRKKKFDEP